MSPGGGTGANDSGGHDSGNDKGNDTIGGNHGNIIIQHPAEKGFSLDDFDLVRVIGRGSYAKVCYFGDLTHFKNILGFARSVEANKAFICNESY